MKTLRLGKSNLSISSIILGMWQAGKEYWTGIDEKNIQNAIHQALESGIHTFDTAEDYGGGVSERALLQALHGKRDQVVLMTKVFSNHLKYEEVLAACERSLKNLGTDYIDLYQIHWPSGSFGSETVPIEETMRAMNALKKQGKIRSIGVSNFSLEQLKHAQEFGSIDSLQPPYSLFWRHIEPELQPYCRAQEITVLAYSPLAQGFLTGRFQKGHQFEKGDHRSSNKLFDANVFPKVLESVGELRELAESKRISLAQLALAWITSHKNTAAIAGARNEKQVQDNAGAGDIELSREELELMDSVTQPVYEPFLKDTVPWSWDD